MNPTPTYRWGLGFIAKRWRHVLWLLPLAGLLIGLGLQLHALSGPTAIGTIQVRPTPRTFIKDAADALHSDKVLSQAIASLTSKGQWKDKPDNSVSKLRRMIRSEQIPGTSLLDVRVSGSSRAESIVIWHALFQSFNEYHVDQRSAAEDAKWATLRTKIENLERNLDEQRRRLSAARQMDLVFRPPGSPADREQNEKAARLKADFESTQSSLEKAKIELWSSEMQLKIMEDPIIVHEGPALPPSRMTWEILRLILIQAGIGLSIGMILTAPVAYLLELLIPRRRPEAHVNI